MSALRPVVLSLLVVGSAFSIATSASAEVRTLNAGDPADATPTISGNPDNPDISAVDATYDSSGSLSITVDFYNSINSLDTSQNYAF